MEVFTVRWVAVIPPKINIYSLIQCGEGDLRATPMTVWIQSLPTYPPGNNPPMLQGRQAGRNAGGWHQTAEHRNMNKNKGAFENPPRQIRLRLVVVGEFSGDCCVRWMDGQV